MNFLSTIKVNHSCFHIFGEYIFTKEITNCTTPKNHRMGGKNEDILFVNFGIFTMFGEFDQNFTKFGENNITTFSFTKFCDIINTGYFTKFGDSLKSSTN